MAVQADGNDLGLAFNLNPLSSSQEGMKNAVLETHEFE